MRECPEQEAERDEAQRDAGKRREQRRARRRLAHALGDERRRELDDPRHERREQARLPRDARRIRGAGLFGERLRRQHDEEDVREERDGVDAVRQRADVAAARARRQPPRLDRVGDVADENRDRRAPAGRARRRARAESRARRGTACRSGEAERDCRGRARRIRRRRRERSSARREHSSSHGACSMARADERFTHLGGPSTAARTQAPATCPTRGPRARRWPTSRRSVRPRLRREAARSSRWGC